MTVHHIKIISRLLAMVTIVVCGSLISLESQGGTIIKKGTSAPLSRAAAVFPCTYYQNYTAGWGGCSAKLPVTVWDQNPVVTGHNSGSCANLACAAVYYGMPIFLALDTGLGISWPEGVASDKGELSAIKTYGGYAIPGTMNSGSNVTANAACATNLNNFCTISNGLATAKTYNATTNIIGWLLGDEPACGSNAYNPPGAHTQPQQSAVPTAVSAVNGYDSSREALIGQASWLSYATMNPSQSGCLSAGKTAFSSTNIQTYDDYPQISPWDTAVLLRASHVERSNYSTIANDMLWAVGMGVKQALAINAANGVTKPIWPFLDGGNDALGYSSDIPNTFGQVSSGQNTVTVTNVGTPNTGFGPGLYDAPPGGHALTVTDSAGCIPAGTHVVSVSSSTLLVMSQNATCTATYAANNELISFGGGTGNSGGGCNITLNLCAGHGNEFRMTNVEVNSAAWMIVINGGLGINVFCHDTSSNSFCLGDTTAGAAAANNLKAVIANLQTYAPIYLQPALGLCSMQNLDGTTSTLCSNGILTYATNSANCPGMASVYQRAGDHHYFVFVESGRRSSTSVNCNTTGATFTATLAGVTGTAHIVYDSNATYDAKNNTTGQTRALNNNAFIDMLGDHGDSYRVKAYEVY